MTLGSESAFASEPVRHPLLTDEARALVAAHPVLRRHDLPLIAPAIDSAVGDVALIPWRVRIAPVNVTSVGSAGCNPYENPVYDAILWEDNRRDDDTILETYVRPEPAGE